MSNCFTYKSRLK